MGNILIVKFLIGMYNNLPKIYTLYIAYRNNKKVHPGGIMSDKKYSAGAVKFSFWFPEFRKILSLLQSGKKIDDIKTLADNDNIFSAATPMRGKQIFTTVSKRVLSISDDLIKIFNNSTLETQKLIVLISLMKTETMFFDFMNELYREKLIVGDMVITDADIRVFFLNKQRENEKIAKWTDATLNRLGKTYKVYLTEAGLLERCIGDRKIIKPLLDAHFEYKLANSDYNQYLKILTGIR